MLRSSIGDLSALGHRVAGVDDEVHQNLLELRAVGEHRRQVGPDLGGDLNLRPDEALQHGLHRLDEVVERHGLLRDHLAPAERQQLAREARGAVGRFENLFRVAPPLVAFGQVLRDHLRVAADGHEQVVEVVRDAARQPSDRFHLLRLAELLVALLQLILRLLPFHHVADDGGKRGALRAVKRRERELAREPAAVFPHAGHFDDVAEREVVGSRVGERRLVGRAIGFANQVHDRPSEHFAFPYSRTSFPRCGSRT